ncbi:MAG: hypothetical protein WCI95_10500 [bacterium]
MNLFFIAASDMDVIIGIIAVVGWILAQIFGKKKADTPPQAGSPPEAGAPVDPGEELRRFFEEIEKKVKPPTLPQPVAPPPLHQKTHREKSSRRSHEQRQETLSSQKQPQYSAAEAAQVFQAERVASFASSRTLARPAAPLAMPELRNSITLRKFIIANEILGKPIALRQS